MKQATNPLVPTSLKMATSSHAIQNTAAVVCRNKIRINDYFRVARKFYCSTKMYTVSDICVCRIPTFYYFKHISPVEIFAKHQETQLCLFISTLKHKLPYETENKP